MIRFMLRTARYLGAFLNGKLDQVMDPRVLIEQAIAEGRRQHALLSEQAAAVIGNQRELEIKMSRSDTEVARLRKCAEQALLLADQARKADDTESAERHERTARVFAVQLASVESARTSLGQLHAKAAVASGAARRAVEQNAFALQRQLTERARLLTDLEAAKLAERMAEAIKQVSTVGPASDVPTLADVRERIDARMAMATGRGEIAAGSVDAHLLDTERSVIDREGDERLEEIRKGLGLGT
ncbi:MAG: PspA/IM30 family protein [Chloroflexota bacterium]|nr:PspA/IM30 family protein [Chloroflexota bacterium]